MLSLVMFQCDSPVALDCSNRVEGIARYTIEFLQSPSKLNGGVSENEEEAVENDGQLF